MSAHTGRASGNGFLGTDGRLWAHPPRKGKGLSVLSLYPASPNVNPFFHTLLLIHQPVTKSLSLE